jgi:hypothetical protein
LKVPPFLQVALALGFTVRGFILSTLAGFTKARASLS